MSSIIYVHSTAGSVPAFVFTKSQSAGLQTDPVLIGMKGNEWYRRNSGQKALSHVENVTECIKGSRVASRLPEICLGYLILIAGIPT